MAKKIPIDTQKLAVNVLRQVDGMRRDKKHCDFLIKVGSEEIPVHRNILSATSDYFGAMFSHPTKENKSGVVEMIGVDTECAIICVDHMYGKEVSILPEKYESLMYVANLMQLLTLRDAIAALLEADLDPKSFAATKKIADTYGCKKLEEICNEFAEENFGLISKEENFGELDKSFIKNIIKSKSVKMLEEEKLDALLKWIKFDSGRNDFLDEVFTILDLSKVSLKFRRNVAECEPLISENLRLYKMFSTSIVNSMDEMLRSVRGEEDEPLTAIAVFDGNSGHIYHWNPREDTWKRMQEMNDEMKRICFSAVVLGGYLYVLMQSKSFYRLAYSDEKARWERMPNMLKSHGSCPPATVLNGYIYVIGGHINCDTLSAEKYSPEENTWVSFNGKEHACRCSEIIASHGFIHSFGGYDEWEYAYVKQYKRFDPAVQTWTQMPPINEEKGCTAAATLGRKIYVLGGYTYVVSIKRFRSVEVFNVETNLWATLKPMLIARSWFRAFGIDKCIYAVGGYNGSPDSIEKYDVEKNDWKMVEIPSGMKLKILESAKIKLSY